MLTMNAGAIAGCVALSLMTISVEAPLAPVMIMLTITGGLINAIQTTMVRAGNERLPGPPSVPAALAQPQPSVELVRLSAAMRGRGRWRFRGSASYFALLAGAMVVCLSGAGRREKTRAQVPGAARENHARGPR
jgi:hypothetical protein